MSDEQQTGAGLRALGVKAWAGLAPGWQPVASLSEIAQEEITPAWVGGHPIVLVRLGDDVFALDGRCTHQNAPLVQGTFVRGAIRCPFHGFSFDVRSGEMVWPGGGTPLPCYSTRVQDGRVDVWVEVLE